MGEKEASRPSIFRRTPSLRILGVDWLKAKQFDDSAEGLWRINNKLYDFVNFIERHPGGADWLELTQGTDITELFETHHISSKPEMLLRNFYVREAKEPRNYKITFSEDGFYKTLKKKVADYCSVIQKTPMQTSNKILDCLLGLSILSAVTAAWFQSIPFAILTGFCLNSLGIASHNYLHKKDNWRMYCLNILGINYREWRISHVISHHMYPNTLLDLEVFGFEPFMEWFPKSKSRKRKIFSVIIAPLTWMFIIKLSILKRVAGYIDDKPSFRLDHLISFLLPGLMYLMTGRNVCMALKLWLISITVCSFLIGFIGTTSGHHHPKVYHEGDELQPSLDFGIFQMNSVIDRKDVKNNPFLSLSFFGYHTLHHMFPTIDHGLLPHLNELFFDTCSEFDVQLREFSWWPLIVGQFRQLLRTETVTLKEMRKLK